VRELGAAPRSCAAAVYQDCANRSSIDLDYTPSKRRRQAAPGRGFERRCGGKAVRVGSRSGKVEGGDEIGTRDSWQREMA